MIERAATEFEKAGVDVGLARVGERGRLEIRALDQPDAAPERQYRLQIVFRAIEVSLQRDARSFKALTHFPEQCQRSIEVRRAFHVDPDEVVPRFCTTRQSLQVGQADRLVEIETELRRLDGNLRSQTRGCDAVEGVEIMPRDFVGISRTREIFPKLG